MADRVNVLVTGGRTYADVATVNKVLRRYDIAVLAQGGAPGADALARHWAERRLVPVRTFEADWEGPCTNRCRPEHRRKRKGGGTYCPMAGVYRNEDMLEEFKPDLVIAFPGGRGTADMVKRAIAALGADRVIIVDG